MKTLTVIFVLCLLACRGEYYPPESIYRGKFDVNDVNKIENYAKDLALARGFKIFEKAPEEMRGISDGQNAFFIAFYNNGKLPIVSISNAGTGSVLSIMFSTNQKFTTADANELAKKVQEDLSKKFNINLELVKEIKNAE